MTGLSSIPEVNEESKGPKRVEKQQGAAQAKVCMEREAFAKIHADRSQSRCQEDEYLRR